MKKNIFAFLIPLITLSLIAFTPIFDSMLIDFKFKINLDREKTINYIQDTNRTISNFKIYFKNDEFFYRKEINKVYKDEKVRIAAMNYLFYLNERNIAAVKNGISLDKNEKLNEVYRKYKMMKTEFQVIEDAIGKAEAKKFSLVKLYKSKHYMNKLISAFSYNLIPDNFSKLDPSTYMGEDINYTASKTLLF